MIENLPKVWEVASFGEVCLLNPKEKLEDDLDVGFMPMSGVPVGYFGKCEFENKKWLHVKKGYTQFKDGDVLFAKITPCFENGKAVIVRDFSSGWGAGSTEYYILRPIGAIMNARYLFGIIKSREFSNNGAVNMSGSVGHKRVPKTFVSEYRFPIPPLAEQKAIAEKLDSLLAQVEATKARLERIPEILKQFRQSVLAAAVSGELTEDWRAENKIAKDSWRICSVGDVASVSTGKTPKRTENRYWDNGTIPWLTSSATGEAYTYQAEQFVTETGVSECGLKIFDVGTLLLAMYGEGKTRGQVTEMMISAACNQACAAITANAEKIDIAYLKLVLMGNYEETRKAAAGGNQPNLNLKKVRNIVVCLPKPKEQTEIVKRVETLFTCADKIAQQVKTAQQNVNNLTQSILTQAFNGELTKEWREQNPGLISGENSAEALLAKIKAEREKLKPVKKARKKKVS